MTRFNRTTAKNLRAGDHFWLSGKFHLAHNVWITDDKVQVETGSSSLLIKSDTPIDIAL